MSTPAESGTDVRYPIGPPVIEKTLTPQRRRELIAILAAVPAKMRAAVGGFDDARWNTPYREGGWTVKQLVHHVADSHANAVFRFKLALTEENPTIKPYDEAAWAALADSQTTAPDVSLTMLDCLHTRWVNLLESMSDADWQRPFFHPERGAMTLDMMLSLYAWHGPHHVAHVTQLRKAKGW